MFTFFKVVIFFLLLSDITLNYRVDATGVGEKRTAAFDVLKLFFIFCPKHLACVQSGLYDKGTFNYCLMSHLLFNYLQILEVKELRVKNLQSILKVI